MNIWTCNNSK